MKKLGDLLALFVIAMVLISFINVLLRYLLNTVIIPLQELVLYFHALVFMLGIVYCYYHDKHVRIDIFYQNFTTKGKSRVNLIGTVLLLIPLFVFVFYISYDYVISSWKKLEGSSETGGLHFIYALKSLLLILPVLMVSLSINKISKGK
jgi:TRAP-type mannitol/chloroaromatic compound transport system permease small subunit